MEDDEALARRVMLDVHQLASLGRTPAAVMLVKRRLRVGDVAELRRAIDVGVRVGLLELVDDLHLTLGAQAREMFGRSKVQLRTYPPEQPKKPARRYSKVLRSRRRGVREVFLSFKQRRARLKAWRDANGAN